MVLEGWKPIGLYHHHAEKVAPDTATVEFEGPEVGDGQIVEVKHMICCDFTTKGNKISLGHMDADKKKYYINILETTNTFRAFMNGTMYLLPEERPFGIVDTPTADDVLQFSVHGIIWMKK